MKRSLEVALKDALSAASADLDTSAAVTRLNARRYQPTRRSRHPWPAVMTGVWPRITVGGATAGAVVVAAMLVVSSGGSSLVPLAYAGYSASPQAPTSRQISATRVICVHSAGPLAHAVLTAVHGRLILAERRGDYIAELFADGRASAVCLSDNGRFAGAGASSGLWQRSPGSDSITPPSGGGGSAPFFPGSDGFSYHATGRAGRDVRSVTFIMPGHKTVQATVKNGWYFAWWPGRDWPTKIRFSTPAGTRTLRRP